MIRRPPRIIRTDTRLPYTSPCRSSIAGPSAWTPLISLAYTQKILSDVVERLRVREEFVGGARERQAPRDGRETVAPGGQVPVDPAIGFALVATRRGVEAARDGAALALDIGAGPFEFAARLRDQFGAVRSEERRVGTE